MKKKIRRGSRGGSRGDAGSPSHYGPVACTSAAAALVQAYLSIDATLPPQAQQQQLQHTDSSSSEMEPSGITARESGDSVLHISESRFDPIKRRFGGKSKPVTLAVGGNAGGGSGGGGSRGPRVTFGSNAKVVATKEAMHAALHCRCVFILLCENASDVGSSSKTSSSSSTAAATSATSSNREFSTNPNPSNPQKRIDIAHLVALSPDDLLTAISVDSFPLVVSPEWDGSTGGRADPGSGSGSGGGGVRRSHMSQATAALPQAFEVMDGPVVVHRPAARPGEPWRGLEMFRPARDGSWDETGRVWLGQRLTAPAGGQVMRGIREGREGDADAVASASCTDGGGGGGTTGFRLDLGTDSAGNDDPSPCGEVARSRKRASAGVLIVCPPSDSSKVSEAVFPRGGYRRGCSGSDEIDHSAACVVALPAGAPTMGTSTARVGPQWASLSLGRDGRASLSPWRGPPSSWHNSFSCLCRAPATDSGIVGLMDPTSRGGLVGGLMLRPLPPTLYVGAADEQGGLESDTNVGGGCTGGGTLLELQGGSALSCTRSLPAPPCSIMSAAVDDGQGILAVLLADAACTALLLARDGSSFPVVEEYRGVAATFTGDFLGNGREQVALLPTVAPASTSGAAVGSGPSVRPRRAAEATLTKAGTGAWEQLPLKTLVKRALVTDCSCVWGNGQRDDLAALPGAGPIRVVGAGPSGVGGGDTAGIGEGAVVGGSVSTAGRKRQRTEDDDVEAAEKGKANSSSTIGEPGDNKRESAVDDHRLGRLSTVVGVLRRRVQAEEARLLRLRQARRGKAALLDAAKMALTVQVGENNGGGNNGGTPSESLVTAVETFSDGLVACFPEAPSPTALTTETGGGDGNRRQLRCAISRVRFHAPSRTLCLDATVTNPPFEVADGEGQAAAEVAEGALGPVASNVCLSMASSSGRLNSRSAVCPHLAPGEAAIVRACVIVPTSLPAGDTALASGTASIYASCMWSWNNVRSTSRGVGVGGKDVQEGSACRAKSSILFARVLVSPQDMLGVPPIRNLRPEPAFSSALDAAAPVRPQKTTDNDGDNNNVATSHLGLFDVGTRLDLLVRSDTPSLEALPQAVRALSSLAALPEPWAGGAAALVTGCSERVAECTLRAGDSTGAAAVLLRVAAGALPDGTHASADHASEEGQALVAAAAQALREEMEALERVARARRGAGGGESGSNDGGDDPEWELVKELEKYTVAQMRSDVLAAQLAGRLVAAAAGRR